MIINDLQMQNQILAALKLWNIFSAQSKKHPCHHPGVEEYFTFYTPVSIKTIAKFLQDQEAPKPEYRTIFSITKESGLYYRPIKRELIAMNVGPAMKDGQANLYKRTDLEQAVRAIINRVMKTK